MSCVFHRLNPYFPRYTWLLSGAALVIDGLVRVFSGGCRTTALHIAVSRAQALRWHRNRMERQRNLDL